MVWKAYYDLNEAAKKLGENYKPLDLLHYGAIGITSLVLIASSRFFAMKKLNRSDISNTPILDTTTMFGFDMLPISTNDCRKLEVWAREKNQTSPAYENCEYIEIRNCSFICHYDGEYVYPTLSTEEEERLGNLLIDDEHPTTILNKLTSFTHTPFAECWVFQLVNSYIAKKIDAQEQISFQDLEMIDYPKVSIDNLFITFDDLENLKQKLSSIYSNSVEKLAERPIDKREKSSMLLIIAGLCKRAGVDPKQRGISKIVLLELEELGIKIKEETIEKYLDELPELIDNKAS